MKRVNNNVHSEKNNYVKLKITNVSNNIEPLVWHDQNPV